MEAVAAHELGRHRDCKTPGCVNDASRSPKTGPYANLCDEHRETVRARISAGARAGARRRWHGEGSDAIGTPDTIRALPARITPAPVPLAKFELEAACRRLPKLARSLEVAHRNHRNTRAARQAAFDAFKVGLDEIAAAARELVAS